MSKPQAPLKDLIVKYITSDSWRGMPFCFFTTGMGLIGIDSFLLRIFNAGLQKFLGLNAPDQNSPNSVFILGMALAILGFLGILIDGYKSIARVPLNLVTHATFKPLQTAVIRNKIRAAKTHWIIPTHLKQHKMDLNDKAAREIALEQTKKHLSRIFPWAEVHYCGIAHIPFVTFLGQNLRNFKATFYEIDHATREPNELIEITGISQQSFHLERLVTNNADLALKISVSHPIQEDLIAAKLGPSYCSINMSLQNPQLGALQDLTTLNRLSTEILEELVYIHRQNHVKRLHIFYAGPTSLAFKIGQIINLNTAPEVIIYNFTRDQGYAWGLSLSDGGKLV